MTHVLIKRGHLDTEKDMPKREGDIKTGEICTDGGLEWCIYKQRNHLRLSELRQKLKQIFPYSLQRERGPANTLILDFWPPGLRDNTFLLVEATWFVVCCYGSPRTNTTESHVSITVLGQREKNTHIYDTHVEKKNKSTPGGVELA